MGDAFKRVIGISSAFAVGFNYAFFYAKHILPVGRKSAVEAGFANRRIFFLFKKLSFHVITSFTVDILILAYFPSVIKV